MLLTLASEAESISDIQTIVLAIPLAAPGTGRS